jgi:arylsulfatase A-like enzyme
MNRPYIANGTGKRLPRPLPAPKAPGTRWRRNAPIAATCPRFADYTLTRGWRYPLRMTTDARPPRRFRLTSRHAIVGGLCAAAVLTSLLATTQCQRTPARPSFVLIVVDSLRADALGCYGAKQSVSPNIDRMASDGLRFERAIAQAPWNVPSISSLLTAVYPSQHGQGTTVATAGETLTLAEALAASGYRTAAFSEVAWPLLQRGFQTFENTAAAVSGGAPSTSGATVTFAEAADWIRGNSSKPFFVLIHTNEVQAYYLGKPNAHALAKRENPAYGGRFIDWGIRDTQTPVGPRLVDALLGANAEDLRYLESLQRGALADVDDAVGRMMSSLKQQGLAGSTVVVLTSSNGDGFRPDLKRVYHGGRLHDDQLHVPLIVSWPSRIAPASIKTLVESTDVAPTLVALAGLAPEARFRGRALVAAKTGFLARLRATRFAPSSDVKKTAFAEESALRVDAQGHLQPTTTRQATLYSDWIQLIDTGQGLELYDLKSDPAAEHNLVATHTEAASALRAELQRHTSATAVAKGSGSDVNDQLRSLGYVQ